MTKDELKDLSMDELETRAAAISEELSNPEIAPELVEERNAELDLIEERKRELAAEIETRKAEAAAVVAGKGDTVETVKEDRTMDEKEIRNSKAYIEAYAKFIKTGDDTECRALLSENGSGTVAVPELVYDTIKTAWDKEGVMALVKKSYLKGNLKVGFEISSSEAVAHVEGQSVSEESLVLGIVDLVPQAIKKWISISDEALDLSGEEYLRYIYEELTYRIAKKAADTLIAKIVASPQTSTTTAPSVAVHTSTTVSLALVAQAMAKLSDEASKPVIIMNKATWGAFKAAQAAGNYGYDPFEGLPVVFNNSLTAFSAATTGVCYAIVGDLGQGAIANFPNGDEIRIKRDDITLAASDLVRFIGREFVALGVVAPGAFVKIIH